ncbi:MAG: beta-aspartyl-peptidase [Bacteroidales bacterium]|nr:beta-aspartyl-peptidase [Bacteroidales bacterium]
MILIKNCNLYSPAFLGKKDVLIAGTKIVAIGETLELSSGFDAEVIDAKGLNLVPGLIDAHVHIAGAGGEGGPATRTPEMPLSMLLEGGITTVVGCLGTDGYTRDPASVLMKCKSLRQEGVSAYMYTGSYQVPTPTLLGDPAKDLAMIDEVIGIGEIALSDHRSSYPTLNELIQLASKARVGGMLGNKAGIINIHMGDAKDPFRPLYDVANHSEIKLSQFLPTHCNRNRYIFEDAKTFGKTGYIDLTASSYPYYPDIEVKTSKAVVELVNSGVPLGHITITSDACGSLPDFDQNGNLIRLEMGLPKSILSELSDLVLIERIPIEKALQPVTSTVADILKLRSKGRIHKGNDADLVLLDNDFRIAYLIAMGKLMVSNYKMLQKGGYEKE